MYVLSFSLCLSSNASDRETEIVVKGSCESCIFYIYI